jgi:hypothetical protein
MPAALGGGVAVVTELARWFAAGDGAGALALFAPDIRIEQPASLPHGGWHDGHDGMASMGLHSGGTGRGPSATSGSSARGITWCR